MSNFVSREKSIAIEKHSMINAMINFTADTKEANNMIESKLNQEAQKQYSQSFASIITDNFFSKNDGISGQEIVSITPVKQVNFFLLKNLFDQWQDEVKKFKSPYFNYKNEEVSQAMTTLANTLSKNILIQKEDFRPLLESAVAETIELLYDPAYYFGSRAEKWMSITDLKSDSKYYKVYKPLFGQIAEAVEQNPSGGASQILQIVSAFQTPAEEKSLTVASLEEVFPIGHSLLEPIRSEPAKPETVISEPIIPEPIHEKVVEETPELFSSEEEFKREVEELAQQPTKSIEKQEEKQEAVIEEGVANLNEKFAEEDIQTLNERYKSEEQQKTLATEHEERPISSLASSISINQRYMFLNDLFNGNETDYDGALYEIETSGSFDNSVEILVQNYARKYDWDMNSDEVKGLLKVVFKRFR